jgi:hypothetical protein
VPLCDWCLALSPRFQAQRECCQIRLLATMPRHAREAGYQRTREVSGKAAEEAQRQLVKAEWQRQKAPRTATARAALSNMKQILKAA